MTNPRQGFVPSIHAFIRNIPKTTPHPQSAISGSAFVQGAPQQEKLFFSKAFFYSARMGSEHPD